MCILKCTADVNARAIAERRNGGIFHLIPLTRDAEGGHEEKKERRTFWLLTKKLFVFAISQIF